MAKQSKSAYDKSLEKVLFTAGSFTVKDDEGETSKVTLTIQSYNGGQAKMVVMEGKRGHNRIPLSLLSHPKMLPLIQKCAAFKGVEAAPTAEQVAKAS